MEGEEAERSFIEIQSNDFSCKASETAIHPAAKGIFQTSHFLVRENNTAIAIVFLASSYIHEHRSLASAGKVLPGLREEGKTLFVMFTWETV